MNKFNFNFNSSYKQINYENLMVVSFKHIYLTNFKCIIIKKRKILRSLTNLTS